VIPTNRPMIRKENTDVVYRTEDEKFRNAAKEIKEYQERGQPVCGYHFCCRKSERLAALLKSRAIQSRGAERQEITERERTLWPPGGTQGFSHRLHQYGGPRDRHLIRQEMRNRWPAM